MKMMLAGKELKGLSELFEETEFYFQDILVAVLNLFLLSIVYPGLTKTDSCRL